MQPIPVQWPFVVGPNGGFTDAMLRALLVGLYGAPTGLMINNNDTLHLFKNNFNPTKNNVLGDFTEVTVVDFPGYAPQQVGAPAGPGRDVDGNWENNAIAALQWIVNGVPLPAGIPVYGVFLTDNAGALLKGFYRFANPVTLGAVGTQVLILPSVKVLQ